MSNRKSQIANRNSRAFTLVELLIVLGIASLIIGIALPALVRAQRSARRTALVFQLQTLSTGLEAYKDDFYGVYPQVNLDPANPIPDTGAAALCRSMFGLAPEGAGDTNPADYSDAKDGPGFRTRRDTNGKGVGKTFGPYLDPDKFRFGYAVNNSGVSELSAAGTQFTPSDYGQLVAADSNGKPFLYAPALTTKPRFSASNVYFAEQGTAVTGTIYLDINCLIGNPTIATLAAYRGLIYQGGETTPGNFVTRVKIMLGDANANGKLDNGETSVLNHPYLLWAAGPDGMFGAAGGKNLDDVLLTD